ncbi:hypothetical protein SFC08_05430 [Lysinibacillus halotolerans]
MNELDYKKALALEQYKEIKASRRHYSNLRFALFPVYFVVQFGLVQLAVKKSSDALLFAEYIMPICGLLVTYVFWTIETRITIYYKDLEQTGDFIEEYLGFDNKVMVNYSKQSFLSNTKLSIKAVYTIFLLYWIAVLIKQLFF